MGGMSMWKSNSDKSQAEFSCGRSWSAACEAATASAELYLTNIIIFFNLLYINMIGVKKYLAKHENPFIMTIDKFPEIPRISRITSRIVVPYPRVVGESIFLFHADMFASAAYAERRGRYGKWTWCIENELFQFKPLHPWQLIFCVGTIIMTVFINEIAKLPVFMRLFMKKRVVR